MRKDIVIIRVPFRKKFIIWTKEVPFLFKIMTLELACDSMGKEFGELFSSEGSETSIYAELVWAGYRAACMEMYKKPRYTKDQALLWAEFMNAESRKILIDEIRSLMGRLKEGNEKASEGLKKK